MSQRKATQKPIRPNYHEPVERLAQSHPALRTPGIHHLRVAHDSWCAMRLGHGICNCNPDVSYVATEGRN